MIEAIGDTHLRNKVASIVWWDFHSRRNANDATGALNPYLDSYNFRMADNEADVMAALTVLGYPEAQARKRATAAKTSSQTMREIRSRRGNVKT